MIFGKQVKTLISLSDMIKTALKKVKLKFVDHNFVLIIGNNSFQVNNVNALYRENKFFSFLKIEANNEIYLIKGLRSLWELIPISTYDWSEKRDDNKIFDLYCRINDLKDKQA